MSGERPGEAAAVEAAMRVMYRDGQVAAHGYKRFPEIPEAVAAAYPIIAAAGRVDERERVVVNLAEAVQALEFGLVDAATSALTGHNSLGCACLRCDNVRAVLAPLAAKLARQEVSR